MSFVSFRSYFESKQEMAFEFTLSETKTISCTKGVEWNFNVAVGLEVGAELIVDVSTSVEVKIDFSKVNSPNKGDEF